MHDRFRFGSSASTPTRPAAVALWSDEPESGVTRKRIILLVTASVVVAVVAFGSWQGVRAWWAWRGIERIEFDTAQARTQLPPTTRDPGAPPSEPAQEATPLPTYDVVEYDTVLAIAKDTKPDDPGQQQGTYADAVLFWLVPSNGGDPSLVSLPRDLLVVDPCTGEETKLDRTLAGCGEGVSGPELVALAVEDYTGIGVDHFATFGFDDFVQVIDTLGGVEICVDYAVRQGTTDILPAGCSVADGETALLWTRSRTTQELVDGEWRFVEGVSDLDRTERQQALMLAMLGRLRTLRSPAALSGIAESLGDSVVLDESLSMGEAVAMAWDLRSLSASRIRRIVVPAEPVVTEDGSFALRGTTPFLDLLGG